jgi:ABC-2 type transport system permease protein
VITSATAPAGRRTVSRAIRAEWTKFRSVPSTIWTAVAVVGLMVGVTVFVATRGRVVGADGVGGGGGGGDDDVVANALRGVWGGQIALVVLGALTATSEFATGRSERPSRRSHGVAWSSGRRWWSWRRSRSRWAP